MIIPIPRYFQSSQLQTMIFQPFVASLILTATLARSSRLPRDKGSNGTVIDDQLYSAIEAVVQANNITGMSVGILTPNGQVEFAAWGNRTESGEQVASDTIFGIGSLSKGFLSASLGILMQDFTDGTNTTALPAGVTEFNWDTKMRDLLPEEWMIEDEFSTKKADLRDLLSHVTGLPTHDASYSPEDSPRDLVLRMRDLRAAYELRQLFEYNNQMFIAGSYVVSKLSGMAYQSFVEERIMLPLNMTSSSLHPDRFSGSDKFSQTWTPSRRRIPFFLSTEQEAELIAGAGGVVSTAEDMLLWAQLILNGGVDVHTNTTIIPQATFDLATTGNSVFLHEGTGLLSPAGYGLGWARLAYRGHEVIFHNGGAPGVSSVCTVYPYDGFAVVVLSNTAGSGTLNVAFGLADHILGLPEPSASAAAPTAPAPLMSPASATAPPASRSNVLSVLIGTYSNVGYGNFTLCSAAQATSSQCSDVVQDFNKVDAAVGKPSNSSELYSAWSRFWGTHLRLTPISGSDYIGEMTTLYVDGYGADHTPFEAPVFDFKISFMEEEGEVVGLGFFVAENESWRAKRGGSIREIADVWFDKLQS
ncbi:beta-lactamase/transpeptidase-like protein [Mycena alexandri]|uniref:Beta-lactamase/transpeptidase-like protein n=1 Tax=Mycena alexandri TaxID=1745969 RepID=A0AAD6WQV5_9AGAR|nr:beta-lactamase/transpeptidase-like protein [Mycena alexandri]